MSYVEKQRIRIKVPPDGENWIEIKTPHEFDIERYNLTKAGRVASGNMKMDLVAKKRRFVFKYNVINSIEMQHIFDLLDTNEMFFAIEYVEHGQYKYATCYVGALPTKLARTGKGVWRWRDVTFNVIER